MIRSMTGYGGAKGVVEGLNVTVELKSVNNRYLDIAVRMPRNFLFAEDAVKSPSSSVSAAARWTCSSRSIPRRRPILTCVSTSRCCAAISRR